ncbi:MAG: phage major capsid protein, P2 family [Parashewanella sp.]
MSNNLTPVAEACLQAFSTKLAKDYSVPDAAKQFSLTQPQETKIHAAILEKVEFLSMITKMDVDDVIGQVIAVGSTGTATGRSSKGRFTSGTGFKGHKYELVETDSCAHVDWTTLAAWGNSGSKGQFMKLLQNNTMKRFALDILRIGFNGTHVAVDTDPVKFPLGEDVNKGWHQLVKDNAPDQIMTDDVYLNLGADPSKLKAGEYSTLEALVTDLKNSLIHTALQEDPDLVVLVGRDLIGATQTHLMGQATTPTEKVAAMKLDKDIAGLRAYSPSFIPGKRLVITKLKNLHCYTQKGTRKRKSENVEDRKRHEDKLWRMEGYAVEEYEAYAAVDEGNMHIGAKPA